MVGGVKENAMGFLEQKPHHRRTKNFQKDKHVWTRWIKVQRITENNEKKMKYLKEIF